MNLKFPKAKNYAYAKFRNVTHNENHFCERLYLNPYASKMLGFNKKHKRSFPVKLTVENKNKEIHISKVSKGTVAWNVRSAHIAYSSKTKPRPWLAISVARFIKRTQLTPVRWELPVRFEDGVLKIYMYRSDKLAQEVLTARLSEVNRDSIFLSTNISTANLFREVAKAEGKSISGWMGDVLKIYVEDNFPNIYHPWAEKNFD